MAVSTPAKTRDILRDVARIGLRYVVMGALFRSGMRMVLNLAGIHTGPVEWVTPFGEFSGAQFAGIWLGISPVFQALGGVVEVAAGLLLLGRRTTTLGAMIAAGCFTNSLLLHYCFGPSPWAVDAILALLSTSLVLFDWRVLVNLFLLDQPTMPISTEGTWETPRTRKVGLALKCCILIYFIYANGFQMVRIKQDAEAQSDLSGVYIVASFSPPNADIQHRWRVAAIDRYAERLTIRTVDGAGTTFKIQPVIPADAMLGHRDHVATIAERDGRLSLVAPNGSVSVLNYSRLSSERIVLTGEVDGVAIMADLHLIPNHLPFLGTAEGYAEPR